MELLIQRMKHDNVEVLGNFFLYDGDKLLMHGVTLEPIFDDGEPKIKLGKHRLINYFSAHFQTYLWRFDTNKVEFDRAFLIHIGNFRANSDGCCLFGEGIANLDNDHELDITNSKSTVKRFMRLTKGLKYLEVVII